VHIKPGAQALACPLTQAAYTAGRESLQVLVPGSHASQVPMAAQLSMHVPLQPLEPPHLPAQLGVQEQDPLEQLPVAPSEVWQRFPLA
jgi:hypothetical protein